MSRPERLHFCTLQLFVFWNDFYIPLDHHPGEKKTHFVTTIYVEHALMFALFQYKFSSVFKDDFTAFQHLNERHLIIRNVPPSVLTWGKSCSPSASPFPPSRSPSSSSKVSRLRAHRGQLSSSKSRGLGTTPASWNNSPWQPEGVHGWGWSETCWRGVPGCLYVALRWLIS